MRPMPMRPTYSEWSMVTHCMASGPSTSTSGAGRSLTIMSSMGNMSWLSSAGSRRAKPFTAEA